jgi:small ligand-binding sensory domain FIST
VSPPSAAIGGMASGGPGPGQNLLITEEGVVDSGAIGVAIEGDVEIRPIVSQGCRPVGKPYVITACRDQLLQKLGGREALEVLVDLLHDLSPDDQRLLRRGPFIGLAVDARKSTFERGDFLVRGIVGLDKDTQAIAVADRSMRVGQTMQFLVRDAASAGEDLTHLVEAEARAGTDHDAGALVFSCNGRGKRMFHKDDHDISCIRGGYKGELPAAGFFAAGEIGPIGGRNFLHGFTASVALFRARG